MAKTSDYLQNIVCLESYDLHTKMRQVLSCIRHAVNVSDNTHAHPFNGPFPGLPR